MAAALWQQQEVAPAAQEIKAPYEWCFSLRVFWRALAVCTY